MDNLDIPKVTHFFAFEPASPTIGPYGTDLPASGSFSDHLRQASPLVNQSTTTDTTDVHTSTASRGEDRDNAVTDRQPETDLRPTDADRPESSEGSDQEADPTQKADISAETEEENSGSRAEDQTEQRRPDSEDESDTDQLEKTDNDAEILVQKLAAVAEVQVAESELSQDGEKAEQGRAGGAPEKVTSRGSSADANSSQQPQRTPHQEIVGDEPYKGLTVQTTESLSVDETDQTGHTSRGPSDKAQPEGTASVVPARLRHQGPEVRGGDRDAPKPSPDSTPKGAVQLDRLTAADKVAPPEEITVQRPSESNEALQNDPKADTNVMSQGTTSEGKAGTMTRMAVDRPATSGSPSGADKTDGSDRVDRVRFVQRVARAFESAAGRGGSIRLRLHPPELGALHLELTVRGGLMAARLEAETTAARNLLLENLPALRDRLAGHDIKVDRFDVDLTDQSSNPSPGWPQDRSQSQDRPNVGSRAGRDHRESTSTAAIEPLTAQRPAHGGSLDVTI